MNRHSSNHSKLSKPEIKFINQSLKALYKNPKSLVFAPLADFFRRNKFYKKALFICLKGVHQNPSYAKGYTVLGSIYFDQTQYEKAIQTFEQALELEPKNMLALRSLSQLYILTRNVPKLKEIYEVLILYNPHDPHIQKITQTLHSAHLKDYDYFTEKTISEICQDLSQVELEKRPVLKPFHTSPWKQPTPTVESIQKLINHFPKPNNKHIPITAKEKKEKQIHALKNLLHQLNS